MIVATLLMVIATVLLFPINFSLKVFVNLSKGFAFVSVGVFGVTFIREKLYFENGKLCYNGTFDGVVRITDSGKSNSRLIKAFILKRIEIVVCCATNVVGVKLLMCSNAVLSAISYGCSNLLQTRISTVLGMDNCVKLNVFGTFSSIKLLMS